MDRLMRLHKKLVKETKTDFFRYLYTEINWDNRMIGIRGPRGVGKTTLLLQHIKQDLPLSDALYVNADDLYFSEHRLIDLAERLVQQGIHYFFIDEIHKYKDWSKELKLIYDYFSESETDDLEEAIEELGEYCSEEEIRLVRIQFLSEMAN